MYAQRETIEIRETNDVDILVEIATKWDYASIEDHLRSVGFTNVQESDFIGRYELSGLIVDLMATDESILGFSNKWYKEGFQTAIHYRIDEHATVKIFDGPHFIASKIEAFKNRGGEDGWFSSDFEDIIFVLENRPTIWDEMNESSPELKKYLKMEFKGLADNPYIEEWIAAHTSFFSPASISNIIQDLNRFVSE